MIEGLDAIELETAPHPEFAVIWMHGLGADGNDFVPVVPELNLPKTPGVRFIFPHAPMIPVTGNNGYVMRAWFDILAFDGNEREADEAGIRAACASISQLIARENERGIPSNKIILAGFSQGGAMAYSAGLSHPEPLAGIMALSAYIPSRPLLAKEKNAANQNTPIFAAHGTHDDVVSLKLGELARDTLLEANHPVEWHAYRMQHSVCAQEIADISAWLAARLGNTE